MHPIRIPTNAPDLHDGLSQATNVASAVERQHPRGDEVEVSLQMGRHERRPAEDDGGEERRRDAPGLPVREGVHRREIQEDVGDNQDVLREHRIVNPTATARAGSSVSVCWVRFAPNGWNRSGVKRTLWPEWWRAYLVHQTFQMNETLSPAPAPGTATDIRVRTGYNHQATAITQMASAAT